MPKKCSKEAYEQKVLARISKNHKVGHMNPTVMKYAVQKHANALCCYCDDKEIKQKAAAIVAQFPKTKIDPLLLEWVAYKHIKNNYQTITLDQAYNQGGVRNCQVLRLRQSDYKIDTTDAFDDDVVVGLRINSRFEIQPRGKVILEDPLEAAGVGVIGLLISGENAHLINRGEIIVEKSIESSSSVAVGIVCDNQGRFDNFGIINFKGEIVGQSLTYGINVGGAGNLENNGTINFKGDIVGQSSTYGIYGFDVNLENNGIINFQIIRSRSEDAVGIYGFDVNLENNGIINFQIIRSRSEGAVGIYGSDVNLKNNSNGIINFKGDIVGQSLTYGILNVNLENNGTINFDGEIVGQSSTYGIRDVNLENNGTINFQIIRSTSSGARGIYQGRSDVNLKNNSNGTINFDGEIVGQSSTYGIYEYRGNLENNGTINFQIIRSTSYPALGIHGEDGNLENNGTINFKGEIVGQSETYGIYGFNENLENNGTINFQIIRSTSDRAGGIYIDSFTVNNNGNGIINFNANIYGVFETLGIKVAGSLGGLNNSGNINFEQNLISTSSYARGIEIFDNGSTDNRLTNSGNIYFNGDAISLNTTNVTGIYIEFGSASNAMTLNQDSLISFNYDATFDPSPANFITGNGEIMYNTGTTEAQTYYPPDVEIDLGGV